MQDFEDVKHYSEGGWVPMYPGQIGCCFMSCNTFGMQNLYIEEFEELCRQSVDVDQQVLEPLTKLRGVHNAKVIGRVTDDWAQFVKECMEGNLGTTLDRVYEHRTDVEWALPTRKRRRGRH